MSEEVVINIEQRGGHHYDQYHCLICNADHQTNQEDGESRTGPEESLVFKELHVIFILRNILEIPKHNLESYLNRWGNPSEWKVNLCGKCREAVGNAKRIYQEILDSMKIYKAVKREIIEVIKKSSRRGNEGNQTRNIITAQSRAFVSNRVYDSACDPFVIGDLLATEAKTKTVTLEKTEHTLTQTEPTPNLEDFTCAQVKIEPASSQGAQEDEDVTNFMDIPVDIHDVGIKTEFLGGATSSLEISQQSDDEYEPESPIKKRKVKKNRRKIKTQKKNLLKVPYEPKRPRAAPLSLLETKNNPDAPHAYDKTTPEGSFCRCGKVYEHAHHLTRHIRESSDDGKLVTLLYCELCKNAKPSILRAYKRRGDLRRHIVVFHEGIRYTCPTCGEGYSRLDKHFREHPDHKKEMETKKLTSI